jgi:hypothetical protein
MDMDRREGVAKSRPTFNRRRTADSLLASWREALKLPANTSCDALLF